MSAGGWYRELRVAWGKKVWVVVDPSGKDHCRADSGEVALRLVNLLSEAEESSPVTEATGPLLKPEPPALPVWRDPADEPNEVEPTLTMRDFA